MLKKSIFISLFISALFFSSCGFLSSLIFMSAADEMGEIMEEESYDIVEAPSVEVDPPMEEYEVVEEAPPPPAIALEETENRNINTAPDAGNPVVLLMDKMNVFYIGVDNPITITVPGVNSSLYKVSAIGANIRKNGAINGYSVTCTRPSNEIKITVAGDGIKTTEFMFRAKRLPDPVAALGKKSGGNIGNGEFKAQSGVGAFLYNFDFDAKCQIQGFMLEQITNTNERKETINRGARYTDDSKRLINAAKPGDIYLYTNVKVRCPGDAAGRKINSMVFKIK